MDDTIIVRRFTTDEEYEIGMKLNRMSANTNRLLLTLIRMGYSTKEPERFEELHQLYKKLLDVEAGFFGFASWDDLTTWQKINGTIF